MSKKLADGYVKITDKGILAFDIITHVEAMIWEQREELYHCLHQAQTALECEDWFRTGVHLADIFCLLGFEATREDD